MTQARRAVALWGLFGFFALRVLGQVTVGLFEPGWLPPWDQWQSGLLPYPALLAAQVVLLLLMATLCVDNIRGHGRFAIRSERVRFWLRVIAALYASAMILRYLLTQLLSAVPLWHDVIPVVFHIVLAFFIYVLGATDQKATRDDRSVQGAGGIIPS